MASGSFGKFTIYREILLSASTILHTLQYIIQLIQQLSGARRYGLVPDLQSNNYRGSSCFRHGTMHASRCHAQHRRILGQKHGRITLRKASSMSDMQKTERRVI